MKGRQNALVLLVVLLAGCGVDSPPTASPPAPVDRAGAPQIVRPRDLASRAGAPCATLLTAQQLRALGLGQVGVGGVDAIGAPMCTWRSGGSGSRVVSASVVLTGDFFVDTYRTRPLPIFRPHEVGGLPAVDSAAFDDGPACTTTVGVADGQTLDVSVARGTVGSEARANACAIGRRAAEEIVSTLPPL